MEPSEYDDAEESRRLELLFVKALFLEKRYRECIATCRKVLDEVRDVDDEADDNDPRDAHDPNPLRSTFMRFYLALSHDELARAMHSFSHAKVTAFDQAAHLYHEALLGLPSAEECMAQISREQIAATEDEDEIDLEHELPKPAEPSSRHDSVRSASTIEKVEHARPWSTMHSAPLSPPTHIRHNSLPVRSPPSSHHSGRTTSSDFDDLESHDSYGEIMTPTKVPRLERDFSSMSLLASPPPKPVSHSLMHPIRMGSPAKPYHVQAASTQTFHRSPLAQHRSSLPKLDTSPVRKQLLTDSEQNSPVEESPVSPLDSDAGDSIVSGQSTISPISLETPLHWRLPTKPRTTVNHSEPSRHLLQTHLSALRTQLHSHLTLLQNAKLRTLEAQIQRDTIRSSRTQRPHTLTTIVSSPSGKPRSSGSMHRDRSFWSFTPVDEKVARKDDRIRAGRANQWRRTRFDPGRYRDLAEAALGEL